MKYLVEAEEHITTGKGDNKMEDGRRTFTDYLEAVQCFASNVAVLLHNMNTQEVVEYEGNVHIYEESGAEWMELANFECEK